MTTLEGKRTSKNKTLFVGGAIFLGLLAVLGSVVWGRSDTGQINVSATIANSNQQNPNADGSAPKVQPISETFANQPNGGLVPQAPGTTPPPEPAPTEEAASTTASTTEDGTGSSTDGENTSSAGGSGESQPPEEAVTPAQ